MQLYFKHASIEAMSYNLPEKCLTSLEVEALLAPCYERIGLHPGRLELMTGIRARHVGECQEPPSRRAIIAAQDLLAKSSVDRRKIDLLIYCSVCRDFLEPATASVVHHALGLSSRCQFFDLSNACLGVLQGWMLAGQMVDKGLARNVLVVASENSGPLLAQTIDYLNNQPISRQALKPYIASLTIGSGAFASLITRHSPDSKSHAHKLVAATYRADTSAAHLCSGGGTLQGMMMETDSQALMEQGLVLATKNWASFRNFTGWSSCTPSCLIPHQVGKAHHEELCARLDIPIEKSFVTYEQLGNTGSVAIAIALAQAVEQGRVQEDQLVAMLGIGSGLSSIMMGVLW